MARRDFSDEEKVTILKKVVKKANRYYQESVHEKEKEDADALLRPEYREGWSL